MSADTWAPAGGAMVAGGRYRVVLSIRAPYSTENITNLESRWRSAAGLNGNFRVDSFVVSFPNAEGIWKATVSFTVLETGHVASGNFLVDGIGSVAQNIVSFIISSGALVLVEVQKFVVGVVSGVTAPVTDALHQVLNPGVLILVVVGIFLIVRR